LLDTVRGFLTPGDGPDETPAVVDTAGPGDASRTAVPPGDAAIEDGSGAAGQAEVPPEEPGSVAAPGQGPAVTQERPPEGQAGQPQGTAQEDGADPDPFVDDQTEIEEQAATSAGPPEGQVAGPPAQQPG